MFCKNFVEYSRRKTVTVFIGNSALGSAYPVRIQSMTNTPTSNTLQTADQAQRMILAGAEYVRITTPTISDTEDLLKIREELKKRNCFVPLIADVHFSAKVAEAAAITAEKVRINPGNFIDTKKFQHFEYTDNEYKAELERIKEKFIPFLNLCKKHKTAIRIGTNHGSLSDRIMSRYGDTAQGMVESTMEFLRICKEETFENVVISMKAGNPKVMITACRLLVEKMDEGKMHFPLHLGVTEAGDGEDGRVKSAVGIGSLLADGIGDTIRVSLTEEPEDELPTAKILTQVFNPEKLSRYQPSGKSDQTRFDYLHFQKRQTDAVGSIGGKNKPIVISEKHFFPTDKISPDLVFNKFDQTLENPVGEKMKIITFKELENERPGDNPFILLITEEDIFHENAKKLNQYPNAVFAADFQQTHSFVHTGRSFFLKIIESGLKNPVVIRYKADDYCEKNLVQAAAEIGSLMIDGFGDGIWFEHTKKEQSELFISLALNIMQACRLRISKTEYISCPSCGRTLFDLKETTLRIKERTKHLTHLKIGIMGCIVNGPGEMADADYGYVGTGKDRVTLYKQKEIITKNIPTENAVEELILLIKKHGDWREPD
jgi:(E)-4-hydroxy-3-methylbut-2-enyl-diphosphate synthase